MSPVSLWNVWTQVRPAPELVQYRTTWWGFDALRKTEKTVSARASCSWHLCACLTFAHPWTIWLKALTVWGHLSSADTKSTNCFQLTNARLTWVNIYFEIEVEVNRLIKTRFMQKHLLLTSGLQVSLLWRGYHGNGGKSAKRKHDPVMWCQRVQIFEKVWSTLFTLTAKSMFSSHMQRCCAVSRARVRTRLPPCARTSPVAPLPQQNGLPGF